MFTLHVFLACFCDVYIQIVHGPLEGGVDDTEQAHKRRALNTRLFSGTSFVFVCFSIFPS